MKKSNLFLACCIGLVFFASCKKDVKPTVNVFAGSGYATQGTELYSGDEVSVGFTANGKDLIQFVMTATNNGNVIYTNTETINKEVAYNYSNTFTLEAEGTVTISGTVTDAAGNTATTSFDIVCIEKPNAKFVGHYEGDALFTGTYDINLSNMDPIHEDLTDQPFATIVEIVAAEDINEVTATITINEQSNVVKGTVDGNKVVFEAINDTNTMNYEYNGITIPITLDMTYNITGTLNNGMFDLDGNCKGSGDINWVFINGTLNMEGTLGGSLTKTE